MKYKYLLLSILSLSTFHSYSQSNKAYAITGQSSANLNWVDIREIDLATGNSIKTIFESGKTEFSFTDYNRNTNIDKMDLTIFANRVQSASLNSSLSNIVSNPTPTQAMVAAAAFDEKHNKLFFMPLRGGELSWLDLNNKEGKLKFLSTESALTHLDFNDEANSITRMAIGVDGNGYAITNDGNHLIQFSTGNRVAVKDLGALIDGDKNKGLSIHNKCSSWGGDIVADAYGKLYLFTAAHNVFVIDPKTRLATFKGTVLGLPGTFTVNGAAVDKQDNVIISSASNFEGFYKVNIKDLKSTKLITTGQVYNASDLANGNLLFQNKVINELQAATLKRDELMGNQFISVYPNPVTSTECKINFDKVKPGTYSMVLTDLMGRTISNRQVFIKTGTQVENLGLKSKLASGLYLLKVLDKNNKSMYSDKIVFE